MKSVKLTLSLYEAKQLSYLAHDLMSDPEELRNRIGVRAFNAACATVAKLHVAMYKGR